MLKKVVFLDRDGVVNRDSPNYIKVWTEFEFLPGSLEALRRLTGGGFTLMIVSNQSAVNRRLTTRKKVDEIHRRMREEVRRRGGRIEDVFFCPHTPEENCDCRKPKPGLIRLAQKQHRIDLTHAVMIGDSARDMQCAKNAGCGKSILVRTGNGKTAEKELAAAALSPDYTAEDLLHAAEWVLSHP